MTTLFNLCSYELILVMYEEIRERYLRIKIGALCPALLVSTHFV